MIAISENEKTKLIELSKMLKQNKDRQSYFACLTLTTKLLQRIYSDGYVVSIGILPELKDCIETLAKFRDESVASFVSSIPKLKMQERQPAIATCSHFEQAYKNAKKRLFWVKDCLRFYYACDTIGKFCGTTPSETNANFILSRIKKDQKFDFESFPAPNHETLLVYFVECAKKGINPIRKAWDKTESNVLLPESYMFHLSSLIARHEKMTVSEWFERKIKPLSKGVPTPLPYMLATEKLICEDLAMPDKDMQYFRKIVHYISWNNLPKDIIINALPEFAQDNKFLQAYKTATNAAHKLHKPSSYSSSKIYDKIINISWTNPNNFMGKKTKDYYGAILTDLRIFVGDSNIFNNPTRELKPIIAKLKKQFSSKEAAEEFLKKYDDPVQIAEREKFEEENSKKSNITIKNPSSNIEEEFIAELKQTYPLSLVPTNFFDKPIGKRAIQIARLKSMSKIEYITSLNYSFTESEGNCVLPEDELFKQIEEKYPTQNISSTVFQKDPLYAQIKIHAMLKLLTVKQYFYSKGYNYTVEKSTTKSMSKDELKELLSRDFPNGTIDVPLTTISYYNQINNLALKERMLTTDFLSSLGFKAEARKAQKRPRTIQKKSDERTDLINSLSAIFPKGELTQNIKGTKLYYDVLAYGRKHNMSALETFADLGFNNPYIEPKLLNEKEFWQRMEVFHPSKIITRYFEDTLMGKRCQRLAEASNKSIEQYINEHGYLYAKLCTPNASEEEVIKKLWLNFPDGVINDKQFFKTNIGMRIAEIAAEKGIDTIEYIKSKGFSFSFKPNHIAVNRTQKEAT